MKKSILLSYSLLFSALQVFAWGQKGHDVVANIATQRLTPTAAAEISKVLGNKTPVYYANYMDNASHTPEYAYTKTWHYKNIDADQTYENAPNIPEGNIVDAIKEQIEVIKNPSKSNDEKALALKMVVHFVGDMHQPMHMGHASDLGGNKWNVKYFGRDSNLHSVWDSSLPESAHKWSYTEWTDQLDPRDKDYEYTLLVGDIDDWGKETFQITADVYDKTPVGTNISYDYIAEWTPVIESQFLKGGVRLADILNTLFDPAYAPVSQGAKRGR